MSGYLNYLQPVKDLINSYISEEQYINKIYFDIFNSYISNFTKNSMNLLNQVNDILKQYRKKISFYGECDKDYCYLKKNPIYKKARLKGYKWRVRGKNVNGRNGYHHIVKEISLNYFHNDAISIYNKFIEKYMSNINKYESIVQLIDQTLKNEKENIINNYTESK